MLKIIILQWDNQTILHVVMTCDLLFIITGTFVCDHLYSLLSNPSPSVKLIPVFSYLKWHWLHNGSNFIRHRKISVLQPLHSVMIFCPSALRTTEKRLQATDIEQIIHVRYASMLLNNLTYSFRTVYNLEDHMCIPAKFKIFSPSICKLFIPIYTDFYG
jgi:hypothetical protein